MADDKNRLRKTYSFFRQQPVYASGGGGGGGSGTGDQFWYSTTVGSIYTTGSVAIRGGSSSVDAPGDIGDGVFFYVSGSIDAKNINYTNISVFGGDVVVSGSLKSLTALSGSLTKLADGTSYLIAGSNITITTGSNGAVTISSTATGGGGTQFFSSTTAGSIFTTGSTAFAGGEAGIDSPADKGTNVFFYVSGSISGSGANDKRALFGGDVVISGSLRQGPSTVARGLYSHAQGDSTIASGLHSHAEGLNTRASGEGSHAEGWDAVASGDYSHAEGYSTSASNNYSHAEGESTFASGIGSHAEGETTTASGDYSHAEGRTTTASGIYSHAEGWNAVASGDYSHAEGTGTASAAYSHAEGIDTISSGIGAHAEGDRATASGQYSHAEGLLTVASNDYSHAEGEQTVASGYASHAEGSSTAAVGSYSLAAGVGTIASGSGQNVFGKYNSRNNTTSLFVIGDGTGTSNATRGDILRVNIGPSIGRGRFDVTGTISANVGLSGSLTRLTDGTSYLIAGTGVSITTGSSGAVTITSTGVPGGSATQVQFNDGGTFGGDSGLTYNKTSDTLTGVNVVLSGDLTVNGTMTTVNTTNLEIKDSVIGLGFSSGTVAVTNGDRGWIGSNLTVTADTHVMNKWDNTNSEFVFARTASSATGSFAVSSYSNLHVNDIQARIVTASLGFSGSLTRLIDGSSYLVAGNNITVSSASNGQVTISATSAGAGDPGASYVVLSATGSLSSERVLTPGTGLTLTDAGEGGNVTLAINDATVATVSGSTFTGAVKFNAGLSGSLTKLTDGTSYLIAGSNVTISSASNGQITISTTGGGSGSGDPNATYVVLSATGSLSSERVLTPGTGLTLADAGAGGNVTLAINDAIVATISGSTFTGVTKHTAGLSGSLTKLTDGTSYLIAGSGISITTGSSGAITITNDGTVGDITAVTAGTGLTGGGTSGAVSLAINDSIVATVSGTTFTGVTKHASGLSGSLTKLTDGTSYLIAGTNVTITTSSNGSITISSTAGGGGGGGDSFFSSTTNASIFTTGSTAFRGSESSVDSPADKGADVFFYVSGSSSNVALFGGNVVTSGSLSARNGLSGSLTKLVDGTSYLVAGNNVTITTSSNGSVTIQAAPGGTGYSKGYFLGSSQDVFGNIDVSSIGTLVNGYDEESDVDVYRNGQLLTAGASNDYTVPTNNTIHFNTTLNLDDVVTVRLLTTGSTSAPGNGTGNAYTTTFTNASLVGGVLTVNHGLTSQYVVVVIYDNNDYQVIPDEVIATGSGISDVYLSSFGTLTGTWKVLVVDGSGNAGDITSVVASTGLTGGGTSGVVSLAINNSVVATVSGTTFTGATKHNAGLSGSLTQLTDGTSYLIAGSGISITTGSSGAITITNDGTIGDITSVTAGTGLTGGGTSGAVTLNINNSVVATVSGTTFTGVTKHNAGLSGSLTQLTDGTSYLIAGSGISITTGSSGAITITNDGTVGDITAVTAGTGLTGGGTSGAVTLNINDSVVATVSGTTFTGNVGVNGGSLTSTASTFNLVNATPTTINFAGAATTLNIGNAAGSATFNGIITGSNDIVATVGSVYFSRVKEKFSTKTDTGGTQTYDCSTGHVFYQSSMNSNFTANFTNLSMGSGYATSLLLILSQSATPYIPTAVQIGGVSQQLNWQGSSAPSGNANKKDAVSFSVLNVSSSYVVLGQLVTFG